MAKEILPFIILSLDNNYIAVMIIIIVIITEILLVGANIYQLLTQSVRLYVNAYHLNLTDTKEEKLRLTKVNYTTQNPVGGMAITYIHI